MKGFIECDTCKAKPGHPILCDGCLENRVTIEAMQKELDQFRSFVWLGKGEAGHTVWDDFKKDWIIVGKDKERYPE